MALFVCFIRAAEFGVSDLFLPNRHRALRDKGHLRAIKTVLIGLPRKVKADFMERSLLTIVGDCEVDPISWLLVSARTRTRLMKKIQKHLADICTTSFRQWL